MVELLALLAMAGFVGLAVWRLRSLMQLSERLAERKARAHELDMNIVELRSRIELETRRLRETGHLDDPVEGT